MMGARSCDGLRLTHLPSGVSVTVWGEWLHPRRRIAYHPAVTSRARSWLASKLWSSRNPSPARSVRTMRLGSSEQPVLTTRMLTRSLQSLR